MATDEVPSANDFKPHEKTYEAFLSLAKWGTIASAIVAVIVVLVLL